MASCRRFCMTRPRSASWSLLSESVSKSPAHDHDTVRHGVRDVAQLIRSGQKKTEAAPGLPGPHKPANDIDD